MRVKINGEELVTDEIEITSPNVIITQGSNEQRILIRKLTGEDFRITNETNSSCVIRVV